MADNIRLTEISREIGRLKDLPKQVKKLSDALDLKDQQIKKKTYGEYCCENTGPGNTFSDHRN